MTRTKLPSQETLLSIFSYDPETGILLRISNGRVPSNQSQYIRVGIDGYVFLAHRVIWKMMTGEEPHLIDHVDGNGRNNKWMNLRSATQSENLRNRGAPINNTSGVKGVSFDTANGLWRASITINRHAINLGRYPTIEEAAEVRRVAAERLHGEFARAA